MYERACRAFRAALRAHPLSGSIFSQVWEDNESCIVAVEKGYSQTLRHLQKTHRLSLSEFREYFVSPGSSSTSPSSLNRKLSHVETAQQLGDVMTKGISPETYCAYCEQLGVRFTAKVFLQ